MLARPGATPAVRREVTIRDLGSLTLELVPFVRPISLTDL